ncbi:MAG: flagellar hook-length control protein FliK [Conexibacter sp.]
MTQIPSALLEPPAPAPSASEPPGRAPDTPFAAVLDDHQARTAVAEGHRRADEQSADHAPARDAAQEGALAALLGGVPLAAGARVVVAPQAVRAEPGPLGGRVLSPGEASREQARGIALPRATRPIGVPADATALPLRPPVPGAESAPTGPATAPSLPIGLDVAGAEGRGDGLGAAIARATRLADVLRAATPAAPAQPAVTPSPATAAGAAGRAQAGANGHASAQAAPATPAAPAATPTAPPASAPASASSDTPLPARAVGLEHAVETVQLALRHGAERGVTHARISLTPRELGSIEVHLRQTADGLVARVVAQHGAAAQQLQQAGAELRRSLEQQGLNVLRLDIGASGDETAGRRGAAFDAAFGQDGRGGRRGDGADPLASLDGAADGDPAATATTTLQLPNGALVDVLA